MKLTTSAFCPGEDLKTMADSQPRRRLAISSWTKPLAGSIMMAIVIPDTLT
jgi:hypothetical protein